MKKRNKRRQIAGLERTDKDEMQTPLQLANLSMLMANLEKTGDLNQANKEAFRI